MRRAVVVSLTGIAVAVTAAVPALAQDDPVVTPDDLVVPTGVERDTLDRYILPLAVSIESLEVGVRETVLEERTTVQLDADVFFAFD